MLEGKKGTAIQVFLILLVGFLGSSFLQYFKSQPQQVKPEKKALPIEFIEVSKGTAPVSIQAYGNVEASKSLSVRAQVSGAVVKVHDNFEIGARIKKDEVLFQIDKRDYEIAIESASAEVERARFQLKQEKGNQIVAKREWELIGSDAAGVSELSQELALRKPQLKEKQASLRAALGRLKKAKLDLERTSVKAPFDILVLSENVELGQFLNPQSIAAELVATDAFYIRASVARDSLRWVNEKQAEPVKIVLESASTNPVERTGKLLRNIGSVDPKGRMAQLLVAVEDPLSIKGSEMPVLLGSYVKVEIQGSSVADVFKIPRASLREGSRVWVVSRDETLEFKDVSVVFSEGENVFVKGDLKETERVITSSLKNALRGTLLKVPAQKMSFENPSSQEGS